MLADNLHPVLKYDRWYVYMLISSMRGVAFQTIAQSYEYWQYTEVCLILDENIIVIESELKSYGTEWPILCCIVLSKKLILSH